MLVLTIHGHRTGLSLFIWYFFLIQKRQLHFSVEAITVINDFLLDTVPFASLDLI